MMRPAGSGTPHVVMVGGGFGGLYAARAMAGLPVRITLLDRRNHHLFQPLLYQVATAGLSPGDIAAPIRSILRHQRNVRVLLREVTHLDLDRRIVGHAGGETPYDFLVLAIGARHDYFGHDEWADVAPGLKSLEDALEVRRRILGAFEEAERTEDREERRRLLTFAVVGGGPTGVEMAGAIAEIALRTLRRDFRDIDPARARVLLVEAGDRVLPSFPEALSEKAESSLRRLGVEVRTRSPVTGITEEGLSLGGEWIACRTVLWAAGVRTPRITQSLGTELDRAGRVRVEADLSIPAHPEVFAIGDMAHALDPAGRMLPGVAPVAMQEGRHVARCIGADLRGLPRQPFHYRDRGSLATIGRRHAVAQIGRLRLWGGIAWLAWILVPILYLIGFDNRVAVLWRWTLAYLTDRRAARLITGDIQSPSPGGTGLPG